jgi:hypothetical protein
MDWVADIYSLGSIYQIFQTSEHPIQDFFGAAKSFFRAAKFSEKTQGDSLLSCRY